jgi:hypothetical protein
MSGGGRDDGEMSPEPVERRSSPRAPARDLQVEGLDRGPLKGIRIAVSELGEQSFFVPGSEALKCVIGGQYRLSLHHSGRSVECTTECVRTEQTPRVGAVFRLLSDERAAMDLLQQVLRPSRS